MLQSEASSLLSSSTVEAQGGTSATEQGSFTTYILCCRGPRRDLFYIASLLHYQHPLLQRPKEGLLLHSEAPSLLTSFTLEAK